LCFHHAVRDDQGALATDLFRLQTLTRPDAYAYYLDIAHFMTGRPGTASEAELLDGEATTRQRWRTLVTDRRELPAR
jgi:hypothetical protein